jgi:hypothetical protein
LVVYATKQRIRRLDTTESRRVIAEILEQEKYNRHAPKNGQYHNCTCNHEGYQQCAIGFVNIIVDKSD